MISFKTTLEEARTISKITNRALKMFPHLDAMTFNMDLTACHANGCPLDLEKLLNAPDADFGHDVLGIARHIDRETGVLGDCFLPRCTR
jgi:hypothetical protein